MKSKTSTNRLSYRWFSTWQKKLALATGLLAGSANIAHATDYNVSNGVDFFNALVSIRATPGQDDRIIVGQDLYVGQPGPAIIKDPGSTLTVVGNGHFIDGDNSYRPFFVQSGKVVIEDVTLQNGLARGGSGSGGALGAGGAIFVGATATVQLQNVHLDNNNAAGGNGSSGFAQGGGGLGGDAGTGNPSASGGAGGFISNGGSVNGSDHGNGGGGGELGSGASSNGPIGGGGGGATSNGSGPVGGGAEGGNAGSPGNPGQTSGGGGGGHINSLGGAGGTFGGAGGTASVLRAPDGGDYGGGGGNAIGRNGDGGFGGGGGGRTLGDTNPSIGGHGGFGGGGGAGNTIGGNGGFGGGDGSNSGGGGGAGFGGAVFVRQGGELIIGDGVEYSGNIVSPGSGIGGGENGRSDGNNFFIMGGTQLTFEITASFNFDAPIGNDDGLTLDVTVTKEGPGILVYSGTAPRVDNTYVNSGILYLAPSAELGGNVTVNANALFGNNGQVDGSVIVNDLGTAYLDGTVGNGLIVNDGGVAEVRGVINGASTINSGGYLTGEGQFQDLTVWGVIDPSQEGLRIHSASNLPIPQPQSPGPQSPIGTITVTGNYTQQPGSGYIANVATNGQSDKIEVQGTATINGGTVGVVPLSGTYTKGMKWTILSAAGGVTGKYDSIISSDDSLTFSFLYLANEIDLVFGSAFDEIAETINEHAVGSNLDNIIERRIIDSDLQSVLDALNGLSNSQIRNGLNQLSGESYGGVNTVQLQNSMFQLRLLSNHLVGLLNSTSDGSESTFGPSMVSSSPVLNQPAASGVQLVSHAEEAPTVSSQQLIMMNCNCNRPDWNGWTTGFGQGANIASNGNSGAVDYSMGGLLFGMDRWLNDDTAVGLFGGYSRSGLSGSIANSHTNINGYQVGAQGIHRMGSAYALGILGYAHDDYSASRTLNFANIQRQARGNYNGNELISYGESGISIPRGNITLQPFGGLQYVLLNQGSFTETGAGSAGLNIDGNNVNSLRSALGTRAFTVVEVKGIPIALSAQARWMHEYLDATQLVGAQFIGGPTSSFQVAGAGIGRDYGIFGLGGALPLTSAIFLYGQYDLQFASRYDAHTGSGGLSVQW